MALRQDEKVNQLMSDEGEEPNQMQGHQDSEYDVASPPVRNTLRLLVSVHFASWDSQFRVRLICTHLCEEAYCPYREPSDQLDLKCYKNRPETEFDIRICHLSSTPWCSRDNANNMWHMSLSWSNLAIYSFHIMLSGSEGSNAQWRESHPLHHRGKHYSEQVSHHAIAIM